MGAGVANRQDCPHATFSSRRVLDDGVSAATRRLRFNIVD
jgi:hypothetical protein